MSQGPSPRAVTQAHAKGWLPPLAWDDIDERDGIIPLPNEDEDDDHTFVDPAAVLRAMRGELTPTGPVRVEAIRRLVATGHSDAAISRLLGCSSRTVLRDRAQHDIPTWRAS